MPGRNKTNESRRVLVRIRDADERDLDGVADLWKELVEHHRTYSDRFRLARDGRKKWSKYLHEKFAERSTKLIVAEEDDALVGFMLCLLNPAKPIFKEKATGIISDAYVVQHRRKKGIMKEMLADALRWFHKNRISAAEVNVYVANDEALRVWSQLGFKPFMVRRRIELDDGKAKALIEGRSSSSHKKTVRKKKRVEK